MNLLQAVKQDAAASASVDFRAGTLVPPAVPCLPRPLLALSLPVLLRPLPAAGPAVLQVGPGAQVQAAGSELRELGFSTELLGSDAPQPRGVPLPSDAGALVPEAPAAAPGGPAPRPRAGPGAGLSPAVRLPELRLAPGSPPGPVALPQLPQGAPHLLLHLLAHHGALGRSGDAQSGLLRCDDAASVGLPPADGAALLPAQHLAVGGGPLWLRPALLHPPPGAAGAVRRRPPPRPAPPQVQLQLRPLLHPLGPAGRDAADALMEERMCYVSTSSRIDCVMCDITMTSSQRDKIFNYNVCLSLHYLKDVFMVIHFLK